MSFYSNVFDARLVLAQIAAMQSLSYISLSCLVLVAHQLFSSIPLQISVIFNFKYLGQGTTEHPTNYALCLAFLINALCFGVQLAIVVERAKKCLDFCVTFFVLHLVLSTWHSGFPGEWRWWVLNALCLLTSSLSGEYFCMKKELQEINVKEFLSMRPSAGTTITRGGSATASSSAAAPAVTTTFSSEQRRANAAASAANKADATTVVASLV